MRGCVGYSFPAEVVRRELILLPATSPPRAHVNDLIPRLSHQSVPANRSPLLPPFACLVPVCAERSPVTPGQLWLLMGI